MAWPPPTTTGPKLPLGGTQDGFVLFAANPNLSPSLRSPEMTNASQRHLRCDDDDDDDVLCVWGLESTTCGPGFLRPGEIIMEY